MNPNDCTVPAQNLVTNPKTFTIGDPVEITGVEGVATVVSVCGYVLTYRREDGKEDATNKLNARKVAA